MVKKGRRMTAKEKRAEARKVEAGKPAADAAPEPLPQNENEKTQEEPPQEPAVATTEGGEGEGASKNWLAPSNGLTLSQIIYVFIVDGLGGMFISGGINFAIAYGMYTTTDTVTKPIRLFQLPNTLAGDAAVTIIIQCLITWFIESIIVNLDLDKQGVQPLYWGDMPDNALVRWLFLMNRPASARKFFPNLIQQALRGFMMAVPSFILFWPISVGILTALGRPSGGDFVFEKRWTPEIFKLLLGGLLGLVTTPVMVLFWLIKAGWESDTYVHGRPWV